MIKKIVILAVLIAPFAYAYYHKPDFASHQAHIYQQVKGADAVIDDTITALPEWDELEFEDMAVCTVTRNRQTASMVSIGGFDQVFTMDSDWGRKAFKAKAGNK